MDALYGPLRAKNNSRFWPEANYRVYALDLLGFGDSDQPPIDYTLDLWQALLKDFWAELIQDSRQFMSAIPLVGFSHNADDGLRGPFGMRDRRRPVLNCAGGLNHRPERTALRR